MVKRRVRQHHADLDKSSRDTLRKRRWRARHRLEIACEPAQKHDRPHDAGEQPGLLLVDLAVGARGVEVAHHDRERLAPAVLALAQASHRRGIGCIAGEVEPAQPLHRDDRPAAQQLRRRREDRVASCRFRVAVPVRPRHDFALRPPKPLRLVSEARRCGGGGLRAQFRRRRSRRGLSEHGGPRLRTPRRIQVQPRPTDEAGVRLRVEAPVGRVAVLGGALGAHREVAHGRHRPVVGHVGDDREARPAVGAVDERVAVAPVTGGEQLGEAVRARRDVGRDERHRAFLGVGLSDLERREPFRFDVLGHHRLDHRHRRCALAEQRWECGDRLGVALDNAVDPVRCVEHPARQTLFDGQVVHEGAEANALDDACDVQLECVHQRVPEPPWRRPSATKRLLIITNSP